MKVSNLREQAESISFRQLKLFESVGRLGSVRRGSEECNLSQPAVTQALGKLEQQLGVTLLERRASGSFLTKDGEIFQVRVQRFFSQLENAILDFGVGGSPAGAASIANRISRSQVRSLLAIIEHRSFAFAAENLSLTQASLQRAARDLEGNLRKTVFHRTASGIIVTPDGVEFGRRIKLATQEIEWAIREIETSKGVHDTMLVIGALPFGGSMLLASLLDEFIAAHPKADVRIITESASEMQKRLRFGDVDLVIGIVQETAAKDLANVPFAVTPFRVVARSGHPLADKSNVTLQDLARYDWIVGMEGASRRACFDKMFEGQSIPKSPVATSALPIIRHLIVGSDRLTLMTSYELEHESDALVAIPFGSISTSPTVGVTMRADWLPTKMHQDFVELAKATISKPMALAA
jgi:DNA-binding transcriptional LysR family regulator